MGAGEADAIAGALLAEGLPGSTPVMVVENASLPERRAFRLALRDLPHVCDLGLSGPALIMIGQVYGTVATESVVEAHARCA